jgi:hypothetical protein
MKSGHRRRLPGLIGIAAAGVAACSAPSAVLPNRCRCQRLYWLLQRRRGRLPKFGGVEPSHHCCHWRRGCRRCRHCRRAIGLLQRAWGSAACGFACGLLPPKLFQLQQGGARTRQIALALQLEQGAGQCLGYVPTTIDAHLAPASGRQLRPAERGCHGVDTCSTLACLGGLPTNHAAPINWLANQTVAFGQAM